MITCIMQTRVSSIKAVLDGDRQSSTSRSFEHQDMRIALYALKRLLVEIDGVRLLNSFNLTKSCEDQIWCRPVSYSAPPTTQHVSEFLAFASLSWTDLWREDDSAPLTPTQLFTICPSAQTIFVPLLGNPWDVICRIHRPGSTPYQIVRPQI